MPHVSPSPRVGVSSALEADLRQRLLRIEGKLDEIARRMDPGFVTHYWDPTGVSNRPGREPAETTSRILARAADRSQSPPPGPFDTPGPISGTFREGTQRDAPRVPLPAGDSTPIAQATNENLGVHSPFNNGRFSPKMGLERSEEAVTKRPSNFGNKNLDFVLGTTRSGHSMASTATGVHAKRVLQGAHKLKQNSTVTLNNYSTHGRNLGKRAEAIHILLTEPDSGPFAKFYWTFMQVLIMTSVFTPLLLTTNVRPFTELTASLIEAMFDVIFLTEVIVRLSVNPAPAVFFFNAFNIIDVLSGIFILMRIAMLFELPPLDDGDMFCIFLLCFLPIIRLLKVLRRWDTVHLLLRAFADAIEALPILIFPIVVITLSFAALIYVCEPRTNIDTLATAVWLTIVTMTTVGYGDYTPESTLGSLIVGVLVISSVMYMAMPLGIVGNSFMQVWQERDTLLLMHRTRERLIQWGYTASDIVVLFKVFDKDNSGELDIGEFSRMIKKMKLGLSDERILELFRIFDDDGSGTIDDKEFVKTVFPGKYVETYGADDQSDDDDMLAVVRQPTQLQQLQADATLVANGFGDEGDHAPELEPASAVIISRT